MGLIWAGWQRMTDVFMNYNSATEVANDRFGCNVYYNKSLGCEHGPCSIFREGYTVP